MAGKDFFWTRDGQRIRRKPVPVVIPRPAPLGDAGVDHPPLRLGGVVSKSGFYDDSYATTVTASGSFGGIRVPWPALLTGDALLDLSTPDIPTVTEDGYYTFSISVGNSDDTQLWAASLGALHVAGSVMAGVVVARGLTPGFVAENPAQLTPLALTVPLLAGDIVVAQVSGGGPAQDFAVSAIVSKIGAA